MLMMKERRPAIRTVAGWARSVLLEAGAIHECEEHGWMNDFGEQIEHVEDIGIVNQRQSYEVFDLTAAQ